MSEHHQDIEAILQKQRAAYLRDGPPSYDQRIENLAKLQDQIVAHKDKMADVLVQDYGNRSRHETLLAEVMASVSSIKHARKKLKKWMKPERRPVGFQFFPAKAYIHYQPLGVVGIMSPWNYPYQLSFVPLAQALAAGNRVMLKPSEFTPGASQLMSDMLAEIFDEDEVATITGGPDVAAAFSGQKFDHLMFTGSTPTGRRVMMAAAENLVPVTLELGGKSPTIIGEDYDLDKAAGSIAAGKMFNSGQTCIAPDYSFVPSARMDEFAQAMEKQITQMYPTLASNPDYTSIVADRHYERINGLLDDAREKGARLIEINPAGEEVSNQRKIAPTLVYDVNDDMKIMQEEIFGPVMPVMSYSSLDEAIDYINAHDRPLALYHFTQDKAERQKVIERTTAGGMTENDVLFHVAVEELPFGGVGPSGIGAYHGEEGFRTFSHAKSILQQSKFSQAGSLRPPYGERIEKLVGFLIGKPKKG
ncbi:MAG: coniferyl aldehyde dehydrogenase [Alphaproteobacteria bacterium]|nr:coniferyl aldehyde dehydrogenase [Alphaproteobacteria bacterium]